MGSQQGPQDVTNLADDFPSPEPSNAHLETMDMSSELANQAAAQALEQAVAASASATVSEAASTPTPTDTVQQLQAHAVGNGHEDGHGLPSQQIPRSHPPSPPGMAYRQHPQPPMGNNEQLVILREFYSRNPNPSRKEYDMLAEKTGRPWNKIREYFRQRRNKLRGLGDLERMEEPGRASGWLQVTYRTAPHSAHVSQLNLYNSYKTRFDPYSAHSSLLGGQDLIQLVCATFPGCEMAKDDEDYVLKGLKEREGAEHGGEGEAWEKGVDNLVEPLRASSWLLSHFQHQPDSSGPSNLTQTDLYTSYASRFSTVMPTEEQQAQHAEEAELREFEAEMAAPESNGMDESDMHSFHLALGAQQEAQDESAPTVKREERLLNPVELITLTRMTFPKCEPAVDESGRFIIKGLERREGVERGRNIKLDEMFPFALATGESNYHPPRVKLMKEPKGSDPNHPLTSLLKRKLGQLHPDPETSDTKRPKKEFSEVLADEEKELLEGLRRFKGSSFGKEVRDMCVNQ